MRKINFSAGPSALPEIVLNRLKEGVLDYNGTGVGIFEIGHRTKEFMALVDEVKGRLLSLLGASSDFEVLFMTGGATQMFSTVPLNIKTNEQKPAGYLISGHWAKEAFNEAKKFREVVTVSSSESLGFKSLPDQDLDYSKYSYVHITSNNTIFGTQIKKIPKTGEAPLICDASSDILSRVINPSDYGLIYAGAQKNLGTSGVTLVVIKKDLIESGLGATMSKSSCFETYSKSNSLHNTPPVSAIVAVHEMLKWIEAQGGVSALEKINNAKADLVYGAIDASQVFTAYTDKEARSKMNLTFKAQSEEQEKSFIKFSESRNLIGLAGHRSVGGLRASLYNAITLAQAQSLADLIKEFDKTNS